MYDYLEAVSLLDFDQTIAKELFESVKYPWEVLPRISEFILALGESLSSEEYEKRGDGIWISKHANVFDSAYLAGPLIICPNAEVRHCAFIRGSAIIGSGAVVGNSTEVKNSIIFNNAQVPHYNYVGDSVLGYRSHLGAGSITSNLKSDKTLVTVLTSSGRVETGLKKFGAMIGDFVEVGCGSVLNPGTVIGRKTSVYPLSMVRGYIPEESIYKTKNEVIEKNNGFCE